jgi:tRNA dimethylallyltransferase
MLADGLTSEVDALGAQAPFAREPARAIGYAEVLALRAGTLTEAQVPERIAIRTRQLLRKQRIAFSAWPQIQWIELGPDAGLDEVMRDVVRAFDLG